jgi:Family of unknown function (DUF6599)
MVVGMRVQFLSTIIFALLSAANLSAQQGGPLLPDRLGESTASGHAFKPITPGDPQVWAEARMVASEARMYSDGTQVDLYQFHDSSDAYAIAMFLTQPPLNPSKIVSHVQVMRGGGLDIQEFQLGNFVARIYAPQKKLAMAMEEKVKAAIGKRADLTPLPPIREYLPKEDLVNATRRYALGPAAFRAAGETVGRPEIAGLAGAVGFGQGAEVMLAQYRRGRDGGVLLLIDYPTPQLAELHSRHLADTLAETAKDAGIKIERRGSLLSMVIAPSSPAYAESLRGAVNYETQVTWNEPGATATDPPWAVVLYRIFVGTGVFMVMAVAFGVAFGGFRIFIKRMLPGKVFDRPEQMEVLQLGLSGNKIDTRDLY